MKNNEWFHFVLVLDKARILNIPMDSNWVKLEWESQKEGSKFLHFDRVLGADGSTFASAGVLLP